MKLINRLFSTLIFVVTYGYAFGQSDFIEFASWETIAKVNDETEIYFVSSKGKDYGIYQKENDLFLFKVESNERIKLKVDTKGNPKVKLREVCSLGDRTWVVFCSDKVNNPVIEYTFYKQEILFDQGSLEENSKVLFEYDIWGAHWGEHKVNPSITDQMDILFVRSENANSSAIVHNHFNSEKRYQRIVEILDNNFNVIRTEILDSDVGGIWSSKTGIYRRMYVINDEGIFAEFVNEKSTKAEKKEHDFLGYYKQQLKILRVNQELETVVLDFKGNKVNGIHMSIDSLNIHFGGVTNKEKQQFFIAKKSLHEDEFEIRYHEILPVDYTGHMAAKDKAEFVKKHQNNWIHHYFYFGDLKVVNGSYYLFLKHYRTSGASSTEIGSYSVVYFENFDDLPHSYFIPYLVKNQMSMLDHTQDQTFFTLGYIFIDAAFEIVNGSAYVAFSQSSANYKRYRIDQAPLPTKLKENNNLYVAKIDFENPYELIELPKIGEFPVFSIEKAHQGLYISSEGFGGEKNDKLKYRFKIELD